MGLIPNMEVDMKSEQKILVKRIKQLCEERGISYYVLSYRSSVPMSTLENIIKGISKNPGIFTIMKICEGLEISAKDFFDTDDFSELFADMDAEK